MTSLKTPSKITSFLTEQTREQVVNSILNSSKSKSAWTFSKQQRFTQQKQQSFRVMQRDNHKVGQILNKFTKQSTSFVPKNHSYGFSKSKRTLFTEVSEAPCSWKYNPEEPRSNIKWKNMALPEGRDKCISGSYIDREKIKVPGPSKYEVKSLQNTVRYSIRPKTGHERTYFIDNKEAQEIPGPGKYNEDFQAVARKSFTSKFRATSLGASGIRSKSHRFRTEEEKQESFNTTNLYEKFKAPWSKGCPIGSQKRLSFIDLTTKLHNDAPGPGKYELPSQFGHYKKLPTNEFSRTFQIK